MKIKRAIEGLSLKEIAAAEKYLFKTAWNISPWQSLLSIFIQIIALFLPLFNAYLWKLFIDKIDYIYKVSEIQTDFWIIFGIFIIVQMLSSLILNFEAVSNNDLGMKIDYALNRVMMDKLSTIDVSFYDDPQNRNMVNAVLQHQETVAMSIYNNFRIILSLLSFIVGFAMFLPHNMLLGILYIITYIPGSIATFQQQKEMDQFSIDTIPETRKKDYYRSILTGAQYAKDLRLYNLAPYMKKIFNTIWNDIRNKRMTLFKKGTWRMFSWSVISNVGYIAVIAWNIYLVSQGRVSIGFLSMYVSLASSLGVKFNFLASSIPYYFQVTLPHITQFIKFVNVDSLKDEGEEELKNRTPEIEFRDVCFRYPGNNEDTLHHVSFTIRSGEKVALLGENGAGKSTIIKLLLRFYKPQSGSILIDHKDIKTYASDSLRKVFGVCFQNFNMYSLTLRENIALSNIEQINDTESIVHTAHLSGLEDFYTVSGKGIDINLTRDFDDEGYQPSGGQWQKIAISRAFFRNAGVIILDEPSSALDPEAEHFVYQSFQKICRKKSGLLISHRLSFVSLVDQIILLHNGNVIGVGTHDELIQKNLYYSEMYHMQADRYLKYSKEEGL